MKSVKREKKVYKLDDLKNKDVGISVKKKTKLPLEFNDNCKPFVIEYRSNILISTLNKQIKSKLLKKENLSVLQDELSTLNYNTKLEFEKEGYEKQSIREYRLTKDEIEKLENEISYIKSGKKYSDYVGESELVISKYKWCEEHEKFKKERLVEEYLEILKKYVNVRILRKNSAIIEVCNNCYNDLAEISSNDLGEKICPTCDVSFYSQDYSSSSNGTKKKNMGDPFITFKKELIQFQGKEKFIVDDEIYIQLNRYFVDNKLTMDMNIIKARKLDKFGKKKGGSLALLVLGIKGCNLPHLYKHINLLGKNMWGWKLHDLSDKMVIIENDYYKTQKSYNEIIKERKSSISNPLRLYHQLVLVGLKVALTDFKLADSSSLRESENLWSIMAITAGYEYHPIYNTTLSKNKKILITSKSKEKEPEYTESDISSVSL
jgi:hypothetical protein